MTLHDQYFRSKFWEMEWREEFIEKAALQKKDSKKKKIKDSEAQRRKNKPYIGNISKVIKEAIVQHTKKYDFYTTRKYKTIKAFKKRNSMSYRCIQKLSSDGDRLNGNRKTI